MTTAQRLLQAVLVLTLGSLPAIFVVGIWGYFRAGSDGRLWAFAIVSALVWQFVGIYLKIKKFGGGSVLDVSFSAGISVVVMIEVSRLLLSLT